MKIIKQHIKTWNELTKIFKYIVPKIKTHNIIFDDNSVLSDKINDYISMSQVDHKIEHDNFLSSIKVLEGINSDIDAVNINADDNYIYLKIDGVWIRWKSITSLVI